MANTFNSSTILGQIASLVAEVGPSAQKAASVKAAKGESEPDSKGSHPSASMDDGNITPTSGEHAAELERELKKSYPMVANTQGSMHAGADNDTPQQGVKKSLVGEDPSVEDNYKDKAYDPGTSLTPTRVDNNDKYASVKLADLHARFRAYSNALLERLDVPEEPSQQTKQASHGQYDAPELDEEEAANIKFAAAMQVTEAVTREFIEKADLVGTFLTKRAQLIDQQRQPRQAYNQKKADDPSAEMLQNAMSGGAPGAGGPEGEVSGAPVMPEEDPAAAGMGGGGGGEGDPLAGMSEEELHQVLEEIISALGEHGMGAESLEEGTGAALPPEMGGGGDVEKMSAARARGITVEGLYSLNKYASAIRKHKKQLNYRPAPAGTQKRAEREDLKNYIGFLQEAIGF